MDLVFFFPFFFSRRSLYLCVCTSIWRRRNCKVFRFEFLLFLFGFLCWRSDILFRFFLTAACYLWSTFFLSGVSKASIEVSFAVQLDGDVGYFNRVLGRKKVHGQWAFSPCSCPWIYFVPRIPSLCFFFFLILFTPFFFFPYVILPLVLFSIFLRPFLTLPFFLSGSCHVSAPDYYLPPPLIS